MQKSEWLLVGYAVGAFIQMGNTMYWTVEGNARYLVPSTLPSALHLPLYLTGFLASAVTWPVSLPIMVLLDVTLLKKYAKH